MLIVCTIPAHGAPAQSVPHLGCALPKQKRRPSRAGRCSITPTILEAMPTPLRDLRRNAGLSQSALAHRAGVAPATIVRIEQGTARRPHPKTRKAIAAALDVDVLDVVEFRNADRPVH